MTTRIIVLILVSLFCKPVAAQSFIEVTVQDTVMLKADYFIYTFLVNNFSDDAIDTTDAAGMRDKSEGRSQLLEKKFTSIISELKKNNFKLNSPTLIDSLTINESMGGNVRSGSVVIYNADSLIVANKILKKYDNVMAYVESRKSITQADEKRLYKKLLEAAGRQAGNIATIAGRKVKQIESVNEKEIEGGYTSYPPLSSLGSVIPGWHTSIGTPSFAATPKDIFYSIGSIFTVRFSLQ